MCGFLLKQDRLRLKAQSLRIPRIGFVGYGLMSDAWGGGV